MSLPSIVAMVLTLVAGSLIYTLPDDANGLRLARQSLLAPAGEAPQDNLPTQALGAGLSPMSMR